MKSNIKLHILYATIMIFIFTIPVFAQDWDRSSIVVFGSCTGTEVTFTAVNHGADMAGSVEWRLFIDNTQVVSSTVQLMAGETFTLTLPLVGTMTFEMDQRPGHPGNSHPRISIDASKCSEALPTLTPTASETTTGTPTSTLTKTSTPTSSSTPTATSTNTVINTETATDVPTNTPTLTTIVNTATATVTNISTPTVTQTLTKTPTMTEVITPTTTATVKSTETATLIPFFTVTSTPTNTETRIPDQGTSVPTQIPTNLGDTNEPNILTSYFYVYAFDNNGYRTECRVLFDHKIKVTFSIENINDFAVRTEVYESTSPDFALWIDCDDIPNIKVNNDEIVVSVLFDTETKHIEILRKDFLSHNIYAPIILVP